MLSELFFKECGQHNCLLCQVLSWVVPSFVQTHFQNYKKTTLDLPKTSNLGRMFSHRPLYCGETPNWQE